MALLTGMTPDGTEVPVQVDPSGRLVAEGLTGPQGAPGSPAQLGGTATAPGLTPPGDTNTGIYSPGADQLAISTGGSGRLFVGASGNVGVGAISAPSFFSGSSTVFSLRDTNTGNVAALKVLGGTGTSAIAEFGAGAGLAFCGTTSAHPYVFYTDSQERLRITAAGLVGVGVSEPADALHLASGDFRLTNGAAFTTVNSTIRSISSYAGSANQFETTRISAITGAFVNRGELAFSTGDDTNTCVERLRIDYLGRIGIGVSAPTEALTVNGRVQSQWNTFVNGGTTSYSGDATSLVTGSTAGMWAARSDSALLFAIGSSEKVRIDSSGRVGVGTTAARSLFHSSGTISANDGVDIQSPDGSWWSVTVTDAGALTVARSTTTTSGVS